MKATDKKLKKILVAVLCLVFALTLFACNYKPPVDTPTPDNGSQGGSQGGTQGGGESGGNTGSDSTTFTVRLSETISNAYLNEIQAIWTDTESNNGAYYSARFDANGVASVTGLDGDFKVTLSAPPQGYTYNPNIYNVNNEDRDVTIKLYKLSSIDNPGADGSDWYDGKCCKISAMGAYRAVLTEDNFENGVRFVYEPRYAGDYSIESLVDVTANKLNPLLDMHNGSSAFINPNGQIVDDGGEANTYTKNFRWEVKIVNIGNVFNFCIYATTLDTDVFPINVDFILDRDGEFTGDNDRIDFKTVEVTHDFNALSSIAFSDMAGAFEEYGDFDGNNGLLDGSRVKYAGDDVVNDGDDAKYQEDLKKNDYYYVIDSDGTKRILYAVISKDNAVIATDSGMGFIDALNSPRKITGKDENGETAYFNYVPFVTTYGEHTQNGYYPVTKEMQLFLQRFSITRRLFNDGNGLAENNEAGTLFMSSEKNQWLFCCGVFLG